MNFRTRYTPRERVSLDFSKAVSRTKQSDLAACDINLILARYAKTGILPPERRQALYGDFSSVPTYLESVEVVRQAHEQFEHLPAKVRDRFQNDPSRFLDFASDPRNVSEMVELGLAVVREPTQPAVPISSEKASKKAKAAEGTPLASGGSGGE